MSKHFSFAQQLLLRSLLGLGLLAALFALIGYPYLTQQAYQRAKVDLEGRGQRFSVMLSSQLKETLNQVELTANAFSQLTPEQGPGIGQQVQQMINALQQANPGLLWIGLANGDGLVLASSQNNLAGKNVSARPWFKNGLQGPTIMDLHEALLLAKLLPPREQSTYRFIDFAAPYQFASSAGQSPKVGVLGVHMDWNWLLDEVYRRFGTTDNNSGITFLVVAADGELRLSTDPRFYNGTAYTQLAEQLQQGVEQPRIEWGDDGKQHTFLLSKARQQDTPELRRIGWTVLALAPTAQIEAPINSTLAWALAALVMGALLSLGLGFASGKRLSNQILKALRGVDHTLAKPADLAQVQSWMPREMLPIVGKASELLNTLQQQTQSLEKALALSEAQVGLIHALVQQAPVPVAMLDNDLRYIAHSAQWSRDMLAGAQPQVGQVHTTLTAGQSPFWKHTFARALAGQHLAGQDTPWDLGHGLKPTIDVNWAVEPWKLPNGNLGGIVVMCQDVSEQKAMREQLRDSEERFKLAVDGLNDGLWDWEIQKRSIYYSPNWKRMLGFEDTELPNTLRAWRKQVHPEDLARVQLEFAQCLNNPTADFFESEFRMLHKDGSTVDVLSRARVLRDKDHLAVRMVGSHVDRTHAKALEENLRQSQITARAEQQANRAKSQFLATVSHEIRNPLNGVVGFARLLTEDLPEGEARTNARFLMQTAESLSLMLTDLLDHAKLEAGQLRIQTLPTHLDELVDSVCALPRVMAQSKGLQFTQHSALPKGAIHQIDPGRVRQVLQNLLSNAIKFTSEGEIQVSASLQGEGDHTLLILQVRDTGPGIPSNKVQTLYKPFEQLHSDPHNTLGGTGLGLSIVQGLVHNMGGTIDHQHNLPHGALFTVRIPAPALQAPAINDSPETHRGLHILIADDEPINLRVLTAFLKKGGHQVTQATDGIQTVGLAQHQRFDVIMLDMDMPGLSGAEVSKKIRAETGPNQHTPLVCISGRELPIDHHEEEPTHDFDVVLSKPLQFDNILSLCSRIAQV